ncbi:MAG: GDSL-type esterase/lipase family protein [Eubacteriales bacterium]|nr:GDSL-type esterase/lipase family protein [Eubacteriales bacterium]
MEKIYVYGDSLLKATTPDADFHYHFHWQELLTDRKLPAVVNRAKMGATVQKGTALVQHDLKRGIDAPVALVGYGGNDSDFDWAAIATDPEGMHLPRTPLPQFLQTLAEVTQLLLRDQVQPLLMTLPPIDAQRYLDFICRNGHNRENIMRWLGDVQRIYRHQEMYSAAIARCAWQQHLPLIDVRSAFLSERNLPDMIAADGIHLTMKGYERLFELLCSGVQSV